MESVINSAQLTKQQEQGETDDMETLHSGDFIDMMLNMPVIKMFLKNYNF